MSVLTQQPVTWDPLTTHRAGSWYARHGKRWFDVVLAAIILVVLLPVLVLVLLSVRIGLGPGLLHTQDRVGRGGTTFRMLKVRTMRDDRRRGQDPISFADRRRTHKHPDDPRHTGLGRILRGASLDELPQLINVLRGDMSLVGPRPELVAVAERQQLVGHPRHLVRPGMTGLWQVSPLRSGACITEGLDLDLRYVAEVSLWRDVAILARTAAAVVRRTGG